MLKRFLGVLFSASLCTAAALAAPPPGMPPLPPQPKVRPAGIPVGYMMASPCVRGMGEHWVNLKNMNAPIYGTYGGKVIFSEIMIPLKTLASGFNFPDLEPLPGHTINHVSVEWHPKGHEGMPVPHYDIHAYYITYAQQRALCPNGIPDPDADASMKM